VPYSPERQPAVVEAVAAIDADVVCLNEVWTEADITAIIEAAAATFPHHAVEMTLEEGASGEPACTPEEAEPLKVCAESNCADTDDLTGCVLTFCAAEFDALSDTCTACAAANIGLNDVAAILEVCTSGSGTFSIQVARALGARVAVTAGSHAKLDACAALGAEVLINYNEQDFVEVIKAETGGRGVDVILDNMGAKYLERNVDALARNGRLVVIGLQGGVKAELNIGTMLRKNVSVTATGLRGRPDSEKAAICDAVERHVWPWIAAGIVKPVIDRVMPIDEAGDAHSLIEVGAITGKLVLLVRA
jgi:D-arabinose 1-dehydrogenase-like Zn-dependent alcohol dehydrogenase